MRGKLTDSPGGFDSVERRESNIQHDQVRLHCLRQLDRLHSVRHFDDGSELQFVLKYRTDDPPKRFGIIYYQNPV